MRRKDRVALPARSGGPARGLRCSVAGDCGFSPECNGKILANGHVLRCLSEDVVIGAVQPETAIHSPGYPHGAIGETAVTTARPVRRRKPGIATQGSVRDECRSANGDVPMGDLATVIGDQEGHSVATGLRKGVRDDRTLGPCVMAEFPRIAHDRAIRV